MDPAAYENWHRFPRGAWIANAEYAVLAALARPVPGAALLDAGCGTGHFSHRFAAAGLNVVGLDVDRAAQAYARSLNGPVQYGLADMSRLPFPDCVFDFAGAITSLCFVSEPASALAELWRVSSRGVLLGLLNRRKHGRGAYRGARWDTLADVRRWAVFLPGGGVAARWVEALIPRRLPGGGFLAVWIDKPSVTS